MENQKVSGVKPDIDKVYLKGISDYSATGLGSDGKYRKFHGHLHVVSKEASDMHDGEVRPQRVPFKFQCPKCKSEECLTHKNWYASKEMGEPLLIGCKFCFSTLNVDVLDIDSPDFRKWVVLLEDDHPHFVKQQEAIHG